MSYYDSSENRIRRKKVSSKNSHKSPLPENVEKKEKTQYLKRSTQEVKNKEEKNNDNEIKKEIYYRKRDKKRKKRNILIKKVLTFILILTIVGSIFATGIAALFVAGTPKITKDLVYSNYISKNVVDINEIPENLKNAIVATEDRRFYEHNGVDIKSLVRSVVNNIFTDTTQGGSTIDMQVSKNLLTNDTKSVKRKIRDINNAIQMNKVMTKDEILGAYLNNIYFGKASYGVSDAAKTYFNKDVRDLNLAQCAMLAGITNNPARYMQHDEAKRRQKVVLEHMYDLGYIDYDQYMEALNDPTPFKSEIA